MIITSRPNKNSLQLVLPLGDSLIYDIMRKELPRISNSFKQRSSLNRKAKNLVGLLKVLLQWEVLVYSCQDMYSEL